MRKTSINAIGVPPIPKVLLGRTGIRSTRFGLGCAVWPKKLPYENTLDVLQTAFSIGIRHLDNAPLYGTEGVIGKALKDVDVPPDIVLSTKCCAYMDDLEIMYREYSEKTVYRSVERSLKLLQVDHLDIVHLHDVEEEDLDQIFAKNGAIKALLDLKEQGIIRSIGFATQTVKALQAAVNSDCVDHIQPYHTYTLLNQELKDYVLPTAKSKNLSILNNAPYAGYILLTGSRDPAARYNYRMAKVPVIEAVSRIESICEKKGVSLPTAALAFSLLDPDIDVTVVGASTSKKLIERVQAFAAPLTPADFEEMIKAAGSSFPLLSPYNGKNPFMDDRGL